MGLNHGQDRQATAANIARRALRHGWLPTLICIVALLAAAGGEAATALLRYERALLQDGENWRLISGHFVHLGWAHLVLNVTALLLVWLLVGNRLSGSSWLLSCALIIATIDAGFCWQCWWQSCSTNNSRDRCRAQSARQVVRWSLMRTCTAPSAVCSRPHW